jgi:hypothetical protein
MTRERCDTLRGSADVSAIEHNENSRAAPGTGPQGPGQFRDLAIVRDPTLQQLHASLGLNDSITASGGKWM